MSSRYLIPLAVAAALAAPVAAHAQEGTYDPGKWLVRVGLSQINPDKEKFFVNDVDKDRFVCREDMDLAERVTGDKRK